MRPYYTRSTRDAMEQSGCPLTIAIIAINFITMVLGTFRAPIGEWLAFTAPDSLIARPWTLLTYPLLSAEIIWMLLLGLWLYMAGSALERAWGTRFYAAYFAAMTVISALGIAAGAFILKQPAGAANWLPVAALSITFYMLNPHQEISVWGAAQVQAKWLALVHVVIVFFLYAQSHGHPLMGFFALAGCAAAYLWVRARAQGAIAWFSPLGFARVPQRSRRTTPAAQRSSVPRDDASLHGLNPLERFARWRRRRQFERLFEDDKK